MKKQQTSNCDPCEQQFEQNVDKMIHEVEGYSHKEHQKREKEVAEAFAETHAETAAHNK